MEKIIQGGCDAAVCALNYRVRIPNANDKTRNVESFLKEPPLLSNLDDGPSRHVPGGESLQRGITVSKNGYSRAQDHR